MNATPQVAIVIVSYNTRELLLQCLASITQNQQGLDLELVVVDNASQDESLEAVRRDYPQALAIANANNRGFGAACNQGVTATRAPFILLLNSDARLTEKTLPVLYSLLRSQPGCGAAGCQVVNGLGQEVFNTRYFLTPLNQAFELLNVNQFLPSRYTCRTEFPRPDSQALDCSMDWIDGACLMLRRQALDEIGLFDEQFFMYSEDEDLCHRLKGRGWSICFSAAATVIHHGGASSANKKPEMFYHFYRSQLLFLRKHGTRAKVWFYQCAMKLALQVKRVGLAGEQRGAEYDKQMLAFKQACASLNEYEAPEGE